MPDSGNYIVPIAPVVIPPVTPPSGPGVAVTNLISRFRRLVLDEPYEDFATGDLLADATDTALSVGNPGSWFEGDVMEPRDVGLELFKVRQGITNPITVKRAHNDSALTAHVAGVTLLKNPRFSGDEIEEALTRICFDLWPQAWQSLIVSITPVQGVHSYALPADVLDLISVTQDSTSPAGSTFLGTYTYGMQNGGAPALIQRNVPTTVSTTGLALYVPNVFSWDVPFNVTYRAEQTVSAVVEGLIADVVVMGAVARVLGVRQVVRTGQDIRQAEPGMASAYLQDLSFFQSEYQRLLRRLYLQLMESSGPTPLWRI